MKQILLCLSMLILIGCANENAATKVDQSKIDLGTFTGRNYSSNLLTVNIPANWTYDLKNISVNRQQQLTKEQVKKDLLDATEIKQVTLFDAKENKDATAAASLDNLPASIVCILLNLKQQGVNNLDEYITNFRTEMAERNTKTAIAKFYLTGTKNQKINNTNYKMIDAEINYPGVAGAEKLVIKNKMLFFEKNNLIYRLNLSYYKPEQLNELLQILSSIVYK